MQSLSQEGCDYKAAGSRGGNSAQPLGAAKAQANGVLQAASIMQQPSCRCAESSARLKSTNSNVNLKHGFHLHQRLANGSLQLPSARFHAVATVGAKLTALHERQHSTSSSLRHESDRASVAHT